MADLVRMEPGVYFSMSDETYHSVFALSYSGIRNLRISTLDFWARSALNAEPMVTEPEVEKDAFVVGKAYDKRIIEGREVFYAAYGPAIDPKDYPTALRTNDDLKTALEANGVKTRSGTVKAELIKMLEAVDPSAVVWESVCNAHAEKHDGKTLLAADLIRRIEYSAAMIERNADLSKAFSGGQPQVSIFWNDPETGIPMKARLDYLKPRAVVDLKTFDNYMGMPLDRAIIRTIANNSYHIQGAHYIDAAGIARNLLREGKTDGLANPEFVKRFLESNDTTFMLVLQQKGIAPITVGRVLPQTILDIGRMEVEAAKFKFAECWKTFGASPWVHIDQIKEYDSTEFPSYMAA